MLPLVPALLLLPRCCVATMLATSSPPSSSSTPPLSPAVGSSLCTDDDFPRDYSAHRIFGPEMIEDPFASSSPAACRAACCLLGQRCQAYYWDYSQVSGPECHYGRGYAVGLRRGQINATSYCNLLRPQWSCNHSRTARSRQTLPPVPESPPAPPRHSPPPPPPATPPTKPPQGAKNVLLLVADDMRPDLPMYGNSIVHAPNLQRIAAHGVTFNQAHVQIAYCCPSRNSFMSGRRPDTTQVWTFTTTWREAGATAAQRHAVAHFADLPQWFKQHGWWTTNTGKTWHNSAGYNPPDDWSDLADYPSIFAWPGFYYDVNNTDVSVARIKHAATLAQPFLVAHGFIKPHLPWIYPPDIKNMYYASYANGSKTVPPATNPGFPNGTTPIAWHQCAEMPAPSLGVPLPADRVSALRLEYFAAITYVDQQIGRMLDALEDVKVADSTVPPPRHKYSDRKPGLTAIYLCFEISVCLLMTRSR
jgi:hypothetical protein